MTALEARNTTARIRRVALRAIQWTLGIVVALVLIIVAVNAFDEDLSPEVEQLLKAPPNSWSAEQNLYFALIGLTR